MEHQLKRKKYIISTEKYKKEPILLSLTVFISVFVRLEIETFSVFFFLFFHLFLAASFPQNLHKTRKVVHS